MENHVDALHLVSLCLEIFGVAVLGFEVRSGTNARERAHEIQSVQWPTFFFCNRQLQRTCGLGPHAKARGCKHHRNTSEQRLLAIRKRGP